MFLVSSAGTIVVAAEESSVNTPTIGTTATMIIRATAMNANADFIFVFIWITPFHLPAISDELVIESEEILHLRAERIWAGVSWDRTTTPFPALLINWNVINILSIGDLIGHKSLSIWSLAILRVITTPPPMAPSLGYVQPSS